MSRAQASFAFLAATLAAAAGLVVIAARPSAYRVEGSLRLPGSPENAAPVLAALQQWAPWNARPDVHHTYGGAAGKPGWSCYWSGGADVGDGRLTLLAWGPNRVDLEVEVGQPGRYQGDLAIVLSPDPDGTRLTWELTGERTRWLAWMDRIPIPVERFQAELEPALAAVEASVEEANRAHHRVERSARVAASPAAVLHQLADLRRWKDWLPGERLDPALSRTYGGAETGRGQSYYWSGNGAVGQGRLTILQVSADRIDVEREVSRPQPSSNDLELRVLPDGDGSRITWAVTGAPSAPQGARGDADTALGKDIEEALALLKSAVERPALGRTFR